MIRICIRQGADAGKRFERRGAILTVGRSQSCDFPLQDRGVSQFHGQFLFIGLSCIYCDLHSRNGSLIRTGGNKIWLGPLKPQHGVQVGDEVCLGRTVLSIEQLIPASARMADDDDGMLETDMFLPEDRAKAETFSASELGLAQFRDFLSQPSSIGRGPQETKALICTAIAELFENAAGVTLVDVLPGSGCELSSNHLDKARVVFAMPRKGVSSVEPQYSFGALRETYAQRKPLLFGSRHALPNTESVRFGTTTSCVCIPLWRSGQIAGFLHLHTTRESGEPLARRDFQLLCLLGNVANMLINQSIEVEQQGRWQAIAAAGEAIMGLSHDATPILATLGKNAAELERMLPQLAEDPSWQYVRRDLSFLRQIVRLSLSHAHIIRGRLSCKSSTLWPIVDEAFQMCGDYFVDVSCRGKVKFINACSRSLTALVDRTALLAALVNCIKNSLGPVRRAWRSGEERYATIRAVAGEDPDAPGEFSILALCDDVGGISESLISRYGEPFVSDADSDGLGLGGFLVCRLVERLGGELQIASSTCPPGNLPAGTVVALRIPTRAVDFRSVEHTQPKPTIMADYARYRTRIEKLASAGE